CCWNTPTMASMTRATGLCTASPFTLVRPLWTPWTAAWPPTTHRLRSRRDHRPPSATRRRITPAGHALAPSTAHRNHRPLLTADHEMRLVKRHPEGASRAVACGDRMVAGGADDGHRSPRGD